MKTCPHGIRAPWACNECDDMFDKIRHAPKGAKRANIPAQVVTEALKTAQLWALLRTRAVLSNEVYWAKVELRKRGYCV